LLLPDFGGHSISKLLHVSFSGSKSPSQANACTILPLFCFTGVKAMNGACATKPVSSVNSRSAAASNSSPGSTSPFGIVHAPASFLAQ
jgi:hypothetical protein